MKTRSIAASLVGMALLGTAAIAHEGHAHQYLGTVERVRPCHFVMTTTAGETKTIFVPGTTKIERGGAAIPIAELAAGTRVSVTVEDDGETAVTVKAGAAK